MQRHKKGGERDVYVNEGNAGAQYMELASPQRERPDSGIGALGLDLAPFGACAGDTILVIVVALTEPFIVGHVRAVKLLALCTVFSA